jgi:hypothetical protein
MLLKVVWSYRRLRYTLMQRYPIERAGCDEMTPQFVTSNIVLISAALVFPMRSFAIEIFNLKYQNLRESSNHSCPYHQHPYIEIEVQPMRVLSPSTFRLTFVTTSYHNTFYNLKPYHKSHDHASSPCSPHQHPA